MIRHIYNVFFGGKGDKPGHHHHKKEGEIHVCQSGKIDIRLDFHPKTVHVYFSDHDQPSACCDIKRHDIVSAGIVTIGKHWGINITWDVCGDRKVKWVAKR